MSQQIVSTSSSLIVWQTESLRLTAFPSPAAQIARPSWWIDIVKERPENITERPKEGIYQEEGYFANGKLVLRLQPTRIDWLFTQIDDDTKREGPNIPTIGQFPEVLDAFLALMFRWFELEACPPLQRLAFGAVLLQPVEDRQSGYRLIAKYLPSVKLDPEGSSDFNYQINRPRISTSDINGLTINRLSKWSVASWRGHMFAMEPTSVKYIPGQEHFACRLELDINTSQYFQGELPRTQLSLVFQELVNLGNQIAAEGDNP